MTRYKGSIWNTLGIILAGLLLLLAMLMALKS